MRESVNVQAFLNTVGETAPPEEEATLAAFLLWHAQVPYAHMAHPRGVWELYQEMKPNLPRAPTQPLSSDDVEFAALLHVLSQARPTLTPEERKDVLAFHRAGAYTRHHLTGIIETYRRWRVQEQLRQANEQSG